MSTPEASDREPERRSRGLPANLRRDQPLVPVDTVAGRALMAVIAILTFLAALSAGAAVLAARASDQWRGAISNEMTIQVRPDSHRKIDDDVARAVMLASGLKEVESVRAVPKAESDKLLEPWLGTGLNLEDLPVPRLIVITIDETNPPDFDAMRALLNEEVPQAFLDDHRTWVDRLVQMARTTVLIGSGILILVFTAMVLTVVFATRGALSGNRHIIEVLHFVGAEGSFVAQEFQKHFLKISMKGAAVGAVLAASFFALASFWQSRSLATPESDQATALFGTFTIGWGGYLGIFATMIVIALLTTITARLTVMRTIYEIDLIRSDPARTDGLLDD